MSKKILIVDDEPAIVKTLAARLMANGYTVEAAYDGVTAISLAHSFLPNLIILDVRMPAGSGDSVFEALQMASSTMLIPVVFISAHGDEELKKRMMDMGASDFIDKPFEADDLLKKITEVIGD